MIVWLASYPRSGNTMLRTMLKQVFGIATYSLYDDRNDIGANAAVASAVGHVMHHKSAGEFVEFAEASEEVFFVKTHDPPRDNNRAIYIVRDGRSASVSYLHYLQAHNDGGRAANLVDVVAGNVMFGSWSEHVDAWTPEQRPNTLLLKYEKARHWPPSLIARVAKFIGRKPMASSEIDFERMQALAPNFFRRADNTANIAELIGPARDLFWMLHGRAMRRLGYIWWPPVSPPSSVRQAAFALRDSCNGVFNLKQKTATMAVCEDKGAHGTE